MGIREIKNFTKLQDRLTGIDFSEIRPIQKAKKHYVPQTYDDSNIPDDCKRMDAWCIFMGYEIVDDNSPDLQEKIDEWFNWEDKHGEFDPLKKYE